MADLDTVTLPVLPLTDDVVLPGMVVTLALETSEAKARADAAAKAGNTLLLVPRLGDGRYAGRHRRPHREPGPAPRRHARAGHPRHRAAPRWASASSARPAGCGSTPRPSTTASCPRSPRPSPPSCGPRCGRCSRPWAAAA